MSKEFKCPKCGSDELLMNGSAEVEYDCAYQNCVCEECEHEFYAVFTFDCVNEHE